MGHKLDKHYNDFGGVDSRSNPLVQDPKTARRGSKNFVWNYQDELQKREGFQHKSAEGSACEIGLIEYKFKDIDTGESRTEILGVGGDGYLNKRYSHFLKITKTIPCVITSYNFYYDDVAGTWRLFFFAGNTQNNAINVSLTMTLDQLKTAINALAVTGLAADVVDEDGTTVAASTLLAYLMDVKYQQQFLTSSASYLLNEVYGWTRVLVPDGLPPFVNAVARKDDIDYEGISYVNLSQACYITDGGWVFKYDGRQVYRAGLPALKIRNGISVLAKANVGGWNPGTHVSKFQLRYKDVNGIQILGEVETGVHSWTATGPNGYTDVVIPRIQNEAKFPIYACKLTAGGTMATGSNVLAVASGHNIKVGQCIRFEELLAGAPVRAYYFLVTAVGATTVTIDVPATASSATPTVLSGQVLNGCYVPDMFVGKRDESMAYGNSVAVDVYGPYYVMLATKADVDETGTFYEAAIFPVPVEAADELTYSFGVPDVSLVVQFDAQTKAGEALPRACKYLSIWQQQLVQAGRPYDAYNLGQAYYPTINDPTGFLAFNNYTVTAENLVRYTEVHLCDFQSIYWTDALYPEGFPQSGLNEESFENNFNDSITGIAPNKEAFFAFKQRSTGYLTGTVATGEIVKEILEADVGSACMNAICEVRGGVMFMDENLGFWWVVAGRLPEFQGYPIQDYFKDNNIQPNLSQLNFKKAKATNFRAQDEYVCYVPSGIEGDPGSSSLFFVFDYSATEKGKIRGMWYIWQDVNAAGGVLSTASDELLISQKQTSNNRVWKQKFSGSKYDYSDHQSAIEFLYKGAYLTMGAPVIDKAWIRCVINSVAGGFNLLVRQYGNFIDEVIGDMTLIFPSGSKKTVKDESKARTDKLSSISWGFYNNEIHQDVRIDGWEVEYSASFDTGEAKK